MHSGYILSFVSHRIVGITTVGVVKVFYYFVYVVITWQLTACEVPNRLENDCLHLIVVICFCLLLL